MNKKKIQALALAGVLTVGVVGGTFAWFTSQDSVTNIFNTGSTDNPNDPDAGIIIEENFPGPDGEPIKPNEDGSVTYPGPITPNQTLTKEVWVKNTANYEQIVRAKITKNFIDPVTGKVVTHYKEKGSGLEYTSSPTGEGWKELDLSYIVLAENLNGTGSPSGWTIQDNNKADTSKLNETNWYYYNNRLEANGAKDGKDKTTDLLKTVTLSEDAGNVYKNLRFDVQVESESIQATNGAIDSWENVPQTIKALNKSTSTN